MYRDNAGFVDVWLFLGFGVLMEEEETGATIGLMSDSG
jgi:hypothetical protein